MTATVKPGQTWRDNDPRVDRFIRVIEILGDSWAVCRTIEFRDGAWCWKRKTSRRHVALARFGTAYTLTGDVK
jgi:hypothetical protein